MKRCLILCLLACTTFSYAQQPDLSIARVKYAYSHVRDTNNRANPHQEQMLLVFGKNASVFTSHDRIERLKQRINAIKQQNNENSGTSQVYRSSGVPRKLETAVDIYAFTNEKKCFSIELIMANKYVIEDSDLQINWQIAKDTSNVGGINCRKATGRFKGRNWIAWYAPEIPVQCGPWKLNGLPGLILLAYDERRDIQFKLEEMIPVTAENIDESEEVISLGTANSIFTNRQYFGKSIIMPAAIKTTKEDMNRLKEGITKNPQAAMNAMLGGQGTITQRSPSNPIPSNKAINSYNNPIELKE
jgi:GLPGLI family protein